MLASGCEMNYTEALLRVAPRINKTSLKRAIDKTTLFLEKRSSIRNI